jgi:acetyl esterase
MARAVSSPALGQRVQYLVAQALAALPPSVQIRLSGKPPVTVDGETLAPEVQLMLALLARRETPVEALSPAYARERRRDLAAMYGVRPVAVGAIEDLEIGQRPGALRMRHYAPNEPGGPHPLLVFYHGGGFTYGDLDTHDGLCRLLCQHAGVHLLAVDYRLAPEDPFPAAVEDAFTALRWARANVGVLGADPSRVGVAGDSAGGNLAAVAAQLTRDEGDAPLALQVLVYPATDATTRRRSRDLFGEGFLLTDEQMTWFDVNYLGEERTHASDPRASPLLASDLSGLAPALVFTAAFDPLRDEGEDYAKAMQAAGTATMLRRFPGLTHAFLSAAGISRTCRDALIEIAGATRAAFAAAAAAAGAHEDGEGPAQVPARAQAGVGAEVSR